MERVPVLVAAALLLVATAAADAVSTSAALHAVTSEGQSSEPVGPAKLEASGESDLSTSGQRVGTGVTAVSFEPPEPPGSDSSSSSSSSSSSMDAPNSAGEARGAPLSDVAAPEHESEEGMDRDADSEEALASQGL